MDQARGILQRQKFVAIFGALISAYLLFHHVEVNGGFQVAPSLCAINATFDCDLVAKSQYSEVLGLPVASLSLFYFLALFTYLFLIERFESSLESRLSQIAFLSSLSLPPSILMFYFSAFKIKAVCIFCLLLYVSSALLCAISFYYLNKHARLSDFFLGARDLLRAVFGLRQRASRILLFSLVSIFAFSLSAPAFLREFYFLPRKKAQSEEVIDKLSESISGLGVSKDKIPFDSLVVSDDFSSSPIIAESRDKIVVIEFMDYQCPACERAAKIIKKTLAKYKDRVSLVVKQFPLDGSCNRNIKQTFHEHACLAAATARCAGAFGPERFWDMHYGIFSLDEVDDKALDELASELSFDKKVLRACAKNPATIERLKRDIELAENLRLQSTPTIFIYAKGRLIRGVSVDMLDTALGLL